MEILQSCTKPPISYICGGGGSDKQSRTHSKSSLKSPYLGSHILVWINFDPNMDKLSSTQWGMRWNSRFHSPLKFAKLYNGYNYLPVFGSKLTHVSEGFLLSNSKGLVPSCSMRIRLWIYCIYVYIQIKERSLCECLKFNHVSVLLLYLPNTVKPLI